MPVKMPDLPKHESNMPLSVGRTKVDVPDSLRAQQQIGKATQGLIEQALAYQDQVEQDAADTEATKRATEYEISFKRKLYGDGDQPGIKNQEGDPTPLYQDFDSSMDEEYQRLTNAEDLSPRARRLVQKRVTDRANQLQMTRLSEFGAQSARYEDNVHAADIDLKKNNLSEATTHIIPGDDSTFAPYDDLYAGIRNSHVRRALKNGTARPDASGSIMYLDEQTGEMMRVAMSPQAQMKMNKDLSDGTYTAMSVLINSGHVDKANALKERYGDSLDPVRKAQIADNFERETIESKGYLLANNPKREKELLKGLDEVSASKIKDKARNIRNSREAEIEQAQNRVDRRNSEALLNDILNRQQAGNAYVTDEQALSNPEFKLKFNSIKDPKTRQAVLHAINQPKESSPEALDRAQALLYGDKDTVDVREMSYAQVMQELSGLSEEHQKFYLKEIMNQKTETGAETRQNLHHAGKILEAKLIQFNVIKPDHGTKSVSGKHYVKYMEHRDQLARLMKARGPMTPQEVEKMVDDYALATAENRIYEAEKPNKFIGNTKVAKANVPAPKPFYELGPGPATVDNPNVPAKPQRTRAEWNMMYRKQFNAKPTPDQLDKYIEAQSGGRSVSGGY